MSLTDSRRMWKLAHDRGTEGLHSHDARRLGVSGNPSQRSKDIADHVPFWTLREARNGRPGSRYWADGFQPSDAIPVRPNASSSDAHDPERGGEHDSLPPTVALGSIQAADEQRAVREPVAICRDSDGELRELVIDVTGDSVEGAQVLPFGSRVYRRAA